MTLVSMRAAARCSRSGKSPGSRRPRRWVASASTTGPSLKIRRVTAMGISGPSWRPVGEGSVSRMVELSTVGGVDVVARGGVVVVWLTDWEGKVFYRIGRNKTCGRKEGMGGLNQRASRAFVSFFFIETRY